MDATLHALGDLLIKAIPTVVGFVFVALYLRRIFFKPLANILEERRKQTEGVRELARKAFEAAEQKTSEFERALQLARAELHQEHDKLRQQWADEQNQRVFEARAEADRQIEEAKRQINAEARQAEADLAATVETLSRQIEGALVKRRVA